MPRIEGVAEVLDRLPDAVPDLVVVLDKDLCEPIIEEPGWNEGVRGCPRCRSMLGVEASRIWDGTVRSLDMYHALSVRDSRVRRDKPALPRTFDIA
jgi:hypothetical protein